MDAETLQRTKACREARFPVCLDETLVRIFGPKGRSILDAIVLYRRNENASNPMFLDNFSLYEKYMEQIGNILGKGVRQVIEFDMLNQQDPLFCLKCPLYERGINRRA